MCITHCGICGSDIHQLDDNWGGAKFPLVPGHEIIGKIVAVGEGVTNVQVSHVLGEGGDRCTLCLCLCDARRAAFAYDRYSTLLLCKRGKTPSNVDSVHE